MRTKSIYRRERIGLHRCGKKILSVLAIAMLLATSTASFFAPAEAASVAKEPTRVINLVYDDSGSMIFNGDNPTANNKVDTWCQAKYAMEVFAAMLGNNDTMNIYYMSQYQNGPKQSPGLTLKGSDGAATNVSKVHNKITNFWNTPIEPVKDARDNLKTSGAEEKWLVILTDGQFEDGRISKTQVDQIIRDKSEDTKVMFFGMGADAGSISADENLGIYSEKAANSGEILDKLTTIGQRVFNCNSFEGDVTDEFSFDVPMAELVVFAQGEDVKLNGVKNAKGKTLKGGSSQISVKNSTVAAKNYSMTPKTNKLNGVVMTYKGHYKPGKYSVDVSGAKTVAVYYKPDLAIQVTLEDEEGFAVTNLEALEAGTYVARFALVDRKQFNKYGNNKKLKTYDGSDLFGKDVEYKAAVTNNGKTHSKEYGNGDKIKLEEGDFEFDVNAYFLVNSVNTKLNYTIFKNKKVKFELEDKSKGYTVVNNGVKEKKPVQVVAKIDGKKFTDEQWKKLKAPEVEIKDTKGKVKAAVLNKTDKPGVFDLELVFPDKGPSHDTYKDMTLDVKYAQNINPETWRGNSEITLPVKDGRSFFTRCRNLIIKIGLILLLIIIILGYMPFIKCYLPKGMKKKPNVRCVPEDPSAMKKSAPGVYEVETWRKFIPYMAERASLKYTPKGTVGGPRLKLKASKNNRMLILNIQEFRKKKYITFDGEVISVDEKKKEISANTTILCKKPGSGWKYTCTPSEEYIGKTSKSSKNKTKTKSRRKR